MTKRMLIDATHPEETRVAVVSGNKLEEYDFESIVRKQLKSNIYLVKVMRVEPSLQAAFVDFGGNRHGFLPFPEIHPDYYRIPVADREALIAEERALAEAQAAREDAEDAAELAASGVSLDEDDEDEDDEAGSGPAQQAAMPAPVPQIILVDSLNADEDDEEDAVEEQEEEEEEATGTADMPALSAAEEAEEAEAAESEAAAPAKAVVEVVGGDAVEAPVFRSSIKRRYKIQEVIKRNQIMLIQVSKEERGNKGAAVTSYISLPGRYCVLMPNSPRGGGVSRKVSNAKDRQRLKSILQELGVPDGMSVILRTAGVARSKAEIKRDLDYLLRLWDQIRELTLKSTAPALIYEEGDLIKRSIRDLYKRELDQVLVSGEEGFKNAREFMRTLMPSHVPKIVQYTEENIPLFFRYQVESQIDAIHNPTVTLKSGGYIVINPTEAMISIDVNSGKATKGRHIEETALKTNIEAAEEIARQLRLRDLGGLIVIDFIDMEDRRGNRLVERRIRDAMADDRARIQLGRISAFGLMEMSRQRLHPSLVETNFETCRHCRGSGLVRTVETTAVIVLRAIEEEGLRGKAGQIKVSVPSEIALYIFNNKREMLAVIEKRYGVRVFLNADDTLVKPNYTIETVRGEGERAQHRKPQYAPVQEVDMTDVPDEAYAEDGDEETLGGGGDRFAHIEDVGGGDSERGEGRRRRGGGGGRGRGRDGGRDGGRDRNEGGRNRGRGDGGRQRGEHRAESGGGEPRQQQQPAFEGEGHQPGAPREGATEGADGDSRRRGRRGGRRRGGRNRSRGERGGSQEGGGNDTPSGDPAQAPQPRESRRDHQPRGEYRQQQPREAAAQHGGNGGHTQPDPIRFTDSSGSSESDGTQRKGWWKRLTEQ